MDFVLNFITGLIIAGVGLASLRYNYSIVGVFGRNNFIESKLGPGTTYPFFKLMSILVIFFGVTMAVSLHDNLLNFLLAPVTNLFV